MRTLEDQIQINAPHSVVWGLLSDFSGVATWAPYLRNSSPVGDVESGVGAYRVMRHFWGFRLEESVVEWDDGSGFEFDVVRVPFPIKDVREAWRIEDAEDHVVVATRVEYEAHVLSRYGDYLPVLRAQRDDILQRDKHAHRVQRYRAALGRTERTLGQIAAPRRQGSD